MLRQTVPGQFPCVVRVAMWESRPGWWAEKEEQVVMVVTPVDTLQGCPSTSTAHGQAVLLGGMKGSFP